jgi:tyrosinase
MQRWTRRQFVKVGLGTSATVAALAATGRRALAVPPRTRRDVGALTASHSLIVSYRKAVAAMKALPASDPRSWTYQAAIHGTLTTPVQTAWNTCAHGSYFFWSWHRMYLYWFERIVQRMSGDCCWTLPYWDWTSTAERQLPPMFRDPTSELYLANRNAAMNAGTGSLPASYVDTSVAFAITDFTAASASLEGTPHGAVHVGVGGLMGSVPTAAQDPIFYLHHCNVDRLWNLWLAQGGGRTDPLTDSTWKNTQFTFFDENGAEVHLTGCEVLRAAEELDYRYENEPAQVNEYCLATVKPPKYVLTKVVLYKLPIPELVLGADVVKQDVDLSKVLPRMRAAAKTQDQHLLLELAGVEAERQPGVVWEVYLGAAPAPAEGERSPRHIGNVALFGAGIRTEAHHAFQPATFSFPISPAALEGIDAKTGTVALTFVPRAILVDGKPSVPKVASPVRVGSVTLTIETSKRQ